jgi:tetratricopeptide (TPR) repeat protein
MDALKAKNQCATCENQIPRHFVKKNLPQCLTCVSLKFSLGGLIKPDYLEKTPTNICVLCSNLVGDKIMRSSICAECLGEIQQETGRGYDELYQNHFRPWLVRASGHILGPLSQWEVEEKIKSKEIGLFDYVQKPFGRWIYIREEEALKSAVEDARRRAGGKEDTVAMSLESTGVTVVTDPPIEDSLEGAREALSVPGGISDDLLESKGYGRQATKTNGLLWSIFLLILTITVGGIVFNLTQISKETSQVTGTVRELVLRANSLKNTGRFTEAKKLYGEIFLTNKRDTSVGLSLISLYLLDQQILEAGRTIDAFDSLSKDHPDAVKFQLLRGLRAMASGDTTLAEEEFKKAQAMDSKSHHAIINLAAALLMKGEPDSALKLLSSELKDSQFDANASILMAEAAVRVYQKEEKKAPVIKALGHIRSALTTERQMRQELILVQAWLEAVLGEKVNALASVDTFFESEPDVSEKLLPLFFEVGQRSQWTHLAGVCQELKEIFDDKARVLALLGMCRMKAQDLTSGREIIEDAHSRDMGDPVVASALSWAYAKVGELKKAKAALTQIKTSSDKKPPFFLTFQKWSLCIQESEEVCRPFESLLELQVPIPLEYAEQVLRKKMKDSDGSELEASVDQELQTAMRYIPFHQIKAELLKSLK